MSRSNVVAVLGGCGFIGSALVRRLLANGHERIVVVDDLSYRRWKTLPKDPWKTLPKDPRIEVVTKNASTVHLKDIGSPSSVYYLCGSPFVPSSIDDPDRAMQANVNVLMNFLENNSKSWPSAFVYASSGEVYGNVQEGCAAEDQSLSLDQALHLRAVGELSPYTVSRVAAEQILFELSARYSLKTTILRLFNVVGPRETHPYFVPEMIRQLQKEEVVQHGNLTTIRNFVWIEDTIDAFIAAARLAHPETIAVNVASSEAQTMASVLSVLATLMDRPNPPLRPAAARFRSAEIRRLVGCTSEAERILHWRSRIPLVEAVKMTIEWYRTEKIWPYED